MQIYQMRVLGFLCGLGVAISIYAVAEGIAVQSAQVSFELGAGLLALLGSVVTTGAGILILWLNQRAAFQRAEQQREEAKQDATNRAGHVASVLAEKVEEDSSKKDAKLDEIYMRVDGRLTKALEEIASLKTIIASGVSTEHKNLALMAGPTDVLPTPPKPDRKGAKK